MLYIRELKKDIDFIALHDYKPECYPYILESTANSRNQQVYSLLFAYPSSSIALGRDGALSLKTHKNSCKVDNWIMENVSETSDFCEILDRWFVHDKIEDANYDHLPFIGGWFVYTGYEFANCIESKLNLPSADDGLPVAFATRIHAALIYNHNKNQYYAVAEQEYAYLVDQISIDMDQCRKASDPTAGETTDSIVPAYLQLIEEDPDIYLDHVIKIKQYIKDGDVFQVNLSRKWQGLYTETVPNRVIYNALRRRNPSPFFGLAQFDDVSIISSSPERLVKVKNNIVETRPIAGTRPRGQKSRDDQYNREALIAHPKERAEHIMLIDLERNDLGKICVPGTISVNELMVVESYAHVHHIVSNVRGVLKSRMNPGDIFKAVFPGGTITGCPKVRCMEIIAELEATGRGAYTGSMGYISRNGNMDCNILIRTLVNGNNSITFRAGAGIVADSDPNKELQETRDKAKGILLALGGA